jgi:tetratricopeptide (TPR) repeat protein
MTADALEETVQNNLAPIAKAIAESTASPDMQLLRLDSQTKKIEAELSQYMSYAKRRCLEGFQFCYDIVKTGPDVDLEAFNANVAEALTHFRSPSTALELSTQVLAGTSWKELLGVADTTLFALYKAALDLLETGRFPEAEAGFYFLTTVDFAQDAFWLGLGHAAYKLGNLNQAINAYETAANCRPGSFWPYVYMANCFERMNDFQEALFALEKAQDELLQHENPDLALSGELKERIIYARGRS